MKFKHTHRVQLYGSPIVYMYRTMRKLSFQRNLEGKQLELNTYSDGCIARYPSSDRGEGKHKGIPEKGEGDKQPVSRGIPPGGSQSHSRYCIAHRQPTELSLNSQ